ncbi:MAG TPA: hypothetical protein VGJ20_38390 [Xanthobacteraceae bacterium]
MRKRLWMPHRDAPRVPVRCRRATSRPIATAQTLAKLLCGPHSGITLNEYYVGDGDIV